jgi:hypothetical protein
MKVSNTLGKLIQHQEGEGIKQDNKCFTLSLSFTKAYSEKYIILNLKLQQTLQNQQKKEPSKICKKTTPLCHSSKFSHFKT